MTDNQPSKLRRQVGAARTLVAAQKFWDYLQERAVDNVWTGNMGHVFDELEFSHYDKQKVTKTLLAAGNEFLQRGTARTQTMILLSNRPSLENVELREDYRVRHSRSEHTKDIEEIKKKLNKIEGMLPELISAMNANYSKLVDIQAKTAGGNRRAKL